MGHMHTAVLKHDIMKPVTVAVLLVVLRDSSWPCLHHTQFSNESSRM